MSGRQTFFTETITRFDKKSQQQQPLFQLYSLPVIDGNTSGGFAFGGWRQKLAISVDKLNFREFHVELFFKQALIKTKYLHIYTQGTISSLSRLTKEATHFRKMRVRSIFKKKSNNTSFTTSLGGKTKSICLGLPPSSILILNTSLSTSSVLCKGLL